MLSFDSLYVIVVTDVVKAETRDISMKGINLPFSIVQ